MHIKKLVIIFKISNKAFDIGKNKNNNVILPTSDPKVILFKETFRFNVRLTVINKRKSIAKFKKPTKSR